MSGVVGMSVERPSGFETTQNAAAAISHHQVPIRPTRAVIDDTFTWSAAATLATASPMPRAKRSRFAGSHALPTSLRYCDHPDWMSALKLSAISVSTTRPMASARRGDAIRNLRSAARIAHA